MKFLLAILLTAALGFLAGLYFTWWALAVVAFGIAVLIPQRLMPAFFSGFLGIFILWAVLCFWIDIKNDSILSHKMAMIFPLAGSSLLMILVSALIGGLVGGMAALAGSSVWPRARTRNI